jgi:Fe-S-cluster containining protein
MEKDWYENGLRFECARCGHCCSGVPGTVRVTEHEIETLAERIGLDVHEFRSLYTRPLRRGEISLREKRSKECVFFDRERGCIVYESRPRQCRSWPFWRAVVHSPERWSEEAEHCPGMNRGPLWSGVEIRRISGRDGTSGAIPESPAS